MSELVIGVLQVSIEDLPDVRGALEKFGIELCIVNQRDIQTSVLRKGEEPVRTLILPAMGDPDLRTYKNQEVYEIAKQYNLAVKTVRIFVDNGILDDDLDQVCELFDWIKYRRNVSTEESPIHPTVECVVSVWKTLGGDLAALSTVFEDAMAIFTANRTYNVASYNAALRQAVEHLRSRQDVGVTEEPYDDEDYDYGDDEYV